MTFTKNPNHIEIGDRVACKREIVIPAGTFSKGHLFRIKDITVEGYDVIDEEMKMLLKGMGWDFERI